MSKVQFPLFVIIDNESNQPIAILSDKGEAHEIVNSMNEFRMEDGLDLRFQSYVESVRDDQELLALVEGWKALEKELLSEGIAYVNFKMEEEG